MALEADLLFANAAAVPFRRGYRPWTWERLAGLFNRAHFRQKRSIQSPYRTKSAASIRLEASLERQSKLP